MILPELNGVLPHALTTPSGPWYWASTPDESNRALDSLVLTSLGSNTERMLRRSVQPHITATITFEDDSTQDVWLYMEQMTFSRIHSTDQVSTWRFVAQIVGEDENSYVALAGLNYVIGVITYDEETRIKTGVYSILWRPAAESWDSPEMYPI